MTEDEFKRMQRQLQNQNFVLVPLDEVKMKEKTNEVSRLKTEMITQMQLDIQRKDELIASANVLIDQLKADLKRKDELIASANVLIDQLKTEVATLKQNGGFYLWDGEYEKHFYDVLVDKKFYKWCWPNAGKMTAIHDSPQIEWTAKSKIMIRLSVSHPADSI
jgi:hypothetical protein